MLVPFWVYLVVGGIMISAYMAVKVGREERQQELESIELEGSIYMERLEQERKKKLEKQRSIEGKIS
ncbi:SigE-dependent sporulation protein [Bacillus methanolicus]|uniref:sporulation YhaL family protein n=1 Tax=Bacillus methanolicus TaxID=1471 RepID=UPI0023802052|nr:sporulation YhaL family protein [Bacillus methanolicus]MDE3838121.1 SigE-dependent sporulation protein [Bacillus methanolicus]